MEKLVDWAIESARIARGKGFNLSGRWYAAWETSAGGVPLVNSELLHVKQRGRRISMENMEKSQENPKEGYLWKGKLELKDNHYLVGTYESRETTNASHGTLFFELSPSGKLMKGKWVGCNSDGPLKTGFGVVAKDRKTAVQEMKALQSVVLQAIKKTHGRV